MLDSNFSGAVAELKFGTAFSKGANFSGAAAQLKWVQILVERQALAKHFKKYTLTI